MAQIPRVISPESTLALAYQGYGFVSKKCRHFDTDIFRARLGFKNTICLKGEEAARMFYETDDLERGGATPLLGQSLLFGKGAVQGLDDEAHHHRKEMFLRLMSRENLDKLKKLSVEQWHNYVKKWATNNKVMLFPEVQELICQAVCRWAEVPLPESEVDARTHDFAAMIEGPGSLGLRQLKGRAARKRANKWIGNLIAQVRDNQLQVSEESALYTVATHRNPEGKLLDVQTAAVELINILRPTVSVARFITFAAVALHKYPDCEAKIRSGNREYLKFFVHEVRRYYPFFPFLVARVRNVFTWQDYVFPKGVQVLLDIYGTNNDPKSWKDPEKFRPERFRNWDKDAYNYIPQGGGDYHYNHRCPGEGLTKELIMVALDFLLNKMQYEVPEQNMEFRLSRIPAIPRSRLIIKDVQVIS